MVPLQPLQTSSVGKQLWPANSNANSNVAYTTFNPTLNYVFINTHTKEEKDVTAQIKSGQEAAVSTVNLS